MARSEVQSTGIDQSLTDRVDSLATWINDIEARLRVAEVATGDERTARELRKALEALSKHDPKLEKRVTDHVTVLTQRFETLASTVSATAAALAAKDGEIAALRRELEDAEKRIETLGSQSGRGADSREVASLRSIVDALSAQRPVRASDSRVDELGGKIRLLAERVDSLTATVTAASATLGKREGDLAALRERLDHGSGRLDDVTAELRRLERDDTLVERLDTLQLAVVTATGGLADREEEAAALRARIDEAYSHVGGVVAGLQRSLGGLSKQVATLEALPRTAAAAIDGRAAELNGRIDAVAQRLDAVAVDVESSLEGITKRDGQLAGLYVDLEAERGRVDALVTELRAELAALPDPSASNPEVESRLEILRGAVVAVTSRLEEIEEASSARESAASSRAGELESALAEIASRLDSVDQEREAAADQLRRSDEVWLQERDWVRRQLERLASLHEDATQVAKSAGPQLEELRARLDGIEAARDAASSELVRVSHAVESERAALQEQLDALAATVGEIAATEAGDVSQERLAELATRIEAIEAARDIASSELVRVSHAVESERAALQEQLDTLAATVGEIAASEAGDVSQERLAELAGRIEAIEAARDAASSELVRVSHAVESERAAVQTQLDALAAAVAEAAVSGSNEITEKQLVELGDRLDDIERRGTAFATELAQATAVWASELGSLGERVDRVDAGARQESTTRHDLTDRLVGGLAARLEALERARTTAGPELAEVSESWKVEHASLLERIEELSTKLARAESAAQSAAAAAAVAASTSISTATEDAVAELNALVVAMQERVASSENEIAALSGARDAGARVEELVRRLESIERATASVTASETDGGATGDGRYRLELRSIELRMEHAEAAARENREAVLTQLERLASRVEWRLQALEAAHEDPYPEPENTGARVVPIRGGADS